VVGGANSPVGVWEQTDRAGCSTLRAGDSCRHVVLIRALIVENDTSSHWWREAAKVATGRAGGLRSQLAFILIAGSAKAAALRAHWLT